MKNPSRSYDFLWLSITLLPLIAISFLLAIQPQDYWWLLRVGQDTVRNGAVPPVDTISLSQFGAPIVYQPWLSGVILWFAYELGGISLTFLLRGLLIGITYGIIWILTREVSNPRLASLLVFILGLASANNWSVRAQLFSYPLFALCLWTLFNWQNGNIKYLWVLPVCTVLWVNLHGSFVLPYILVSTAIVFGKGYKKPLIITFAAMIFVSLFNPYMLGVWRYMVFMLDSPSDQLFAFEWAPPSNEGWQLHIFFAWILLFAPFVAFSTRKLSIMEWVWFLGFGWLALSGLRYGIWFLFIMTILTASLLAEWTKKLEPSEQTFPVLNIGLGIFIISLAILFLPRLREKWMGNTVRIYEMETTPLAATEWLSHQTDLRGPLWTDYAFGGYLSFALQSRRPWMDSRFNAFPPAQWTEYVQVTNAEYWQEMFDREKINLLMLSTAAQPKLIQAASVSSDWCEKYRDDYAVIFVRCEPMQ